MTEKTLSKIFRVLLVALLVIGSTPTPLSAHHFVNLADDSRFQSGTWAGNENYVFYWWALTSSSLWWWAEPDLVAATQQAANNWTNSNGLPFLQVSTRSSADLEVVEDNSISAWAYISVTEIRSANGANYSYKGRAVIRNSPSDPVAAPQGGWQGTITHEVGHFMGLHERYRDISDGSSFCNAESTIMNSGSCSNRPSAPSTLDRNRINAIWKGGNLLNMAASPSGTSLSATWKDGAWGEYAHQMYFYYWTGSAWQIVNQVDHNTNIGMREVAYNTRTLTRAWNRTSYGKPAGWYTACGWSVHKYGGPGTWACAPSIWVP